MKPSVISVQLALCALLVFVSNVAMKDIDIDLSTEEEEEAVKKFQKLTQNTNGKLAVTGLREALGEVVEKLTDDDLNDIMRAADKDGNGALNTDEYLRLMYFRKVFLYMDADADGYISAGELQCAFKTFKQILTLDDAKGLIDSATGSRHPQDARINYAEFVTFFILTL